MTIQDIKHILARIINEETDYSQSLKTNSLPLFYNKKTNEVSVGSEDGQSSEDVINGHYCVDDNLLNFHDTLPTIKMIDKSIAAVKKYYDYDIDKSTLSIAVDEKSGKSGYKPVDYTIYIKDYLMPNHWKSDDFKHDCALHLSDMSTKRDKMGDYLKDREEHIGKRLAMPNGEEMTMAQWRALHNTSENKNNKKQDMAKIRLTESELKNVVYEAVKNIISELDWRTYQSAYEKDTNPQRANRFRQAATNAFNRQNGYGLDNVPYGDGDDTNLTADGDYYGGSNVYGTKGNEFNTYSGTAIDGERSGTYYNAQSIGTSSDHTRNGHQIKGNRGQSLEPDTMELKKKTTFNPLLKMKQMQGDKQVRNYFNGKSQYKNGKWS